MTALVVGGEGERKRCLPGVFAAIKSSNKATGGFPPQRLYGRAASV